MIYPILNFNTSSASEFVDCWSKHYAYQEKNEMKLFYNDNINVRPFTPASLTKLFKWKNGIEEKMAENKMIFLNGVFEKIDFLNELAIIWDEEKFNAVFMPYKKATVWNIFLMHILQPSMYPIFDQHVYRGYSYIIKNANFELENNNSEKFRIYKEHYIPFFLQLKTETGRSTKQIDEAVWAFGKFVKAYPNFIQ